MDSSLKHQVRAFYDEYHRQRLRTPDEYQLKRVWSFFRGKTLEVGAGRWLWTPPCLMDYIVADVSTEAVKRAVNVGVLGIIGDGESLPFADREFDTVGCHDVLEHVVSPKDLISEMCRVSRGQVVIAGPNYVGDQPATGINRRLPLQALRFLLGSGRGCYAKPNPHLSFDADWCPDADAITASNAWWVVHEMQGQGFHTTIAETWARDFHWLNRFPVLRYIGPFMIVLGMWKGRQRCP